MRLSSIGRLVASSLLAASFLADFGCAPQTGAGGKGSGQNSEGAGGGSGIADASVGAGGFVGAGGDFQTFHDASAPNSGGSTGNVDACAAITHKPEEIIVYKDATVTDTIITLKPIALYIMQDRSSSMVGGGGGDPTSWPNSVNAITAFVNDPQSAGLDVGLAAFPPVGESEDCATGSTCGKDIVPIGSLPNNASAIQQGLASAAPPGNGAGTPTECALRGMINQCLRHTSTTGEKCVAVLVTDGEPTRCDENEDNLAAVIKEGFDKGILTFTLGLPGSNISFLNKLAQSGGTTTAVDVGSGAQGQAAFVAALNGIRDKVVDTTTTVISTPVTISAPLECQWGIPTPDEGQTFDKGRVNVQLTPDQGAPKSFGYVADLADCERAGDGWYYDDPAQPTEIRVCPTTCETIKLTSQARIDLLFGCETVPAKFN